MTSSTKKTKIKLKFIMKLLVDRMAWNALPCTETKNRTHKKRKKNRI